MLTKAKSVLSMRRCHTRWRSNRGSPTTPLLRTSDGSIEGERKLL